MDTDAGTERDTHGTDPFFYAPARTVTVAKPGRPIVYAHIPAHLFVAYPDTARSIRATPADTDADAGGFGYPRD